jgi:hypothetical protein
MEKKRGPSKHKTVGPTVGPVMATVGKQLAQMPRPSRLSADYKFKVGLRSANSWLQYQLLADCLPTMNFQLRT